MLGAHNVPQLVLRSSRFSLGSHSLQIDAAAVFIDLPPIRWTSRLGHIRGGLTVSLVSVKPGKVTFSRGEDIPWMRHLHTLKRARCNRQSPNSN